MNPSCKNGPDRFCCICGHVVFLDSQTIITDSVKKTYEEYFGLRLRHQDKPVAPHICCKTCGKNLLDLRNKKKERDGIWQTNGLEVNEGPHYRSLLLHDKSQKH